LLGTDKAFVVSSADGLDELSTSDSTQVVEVNGNQITSYEVTPEELGLKRVDPALIQGGDPQHNAAITRDIFSGVDSPNRELALLNAGAAIYAGGGAPGLKEAVALATQVVDSGRATATLDAYVALSQELAPA
jgi:anthranilate phosphoribosyltransferase